MPIDNPNKPSKYSGGKPKIILRSQIEEAQKQTKSNLAASKYLNVSYPHYKKYAKLYGIFDQHTNQKGTGIEKGYSHRPSSIPLKDILENKYPKYSRAKLKNRLIARKKLEEECALCGFNEKRISDGQIPLLLTHKDNNKLNFNLTNLELLCYNCMFLTTGAPSVAYRNQIKRSFHNPETIPKLSRLEKRVGDSFDIKEDKILSNKENIYNKEVLTEEEKYQILKDLGKFEE
jgi:5-methylcytosine-specific restriction endonuclease McrA